MSEELDSTRNTFLKELRKKTKHVVVDEKVAGYIDELLLGSESDEFKKVLSESLALEHSDMQVPLSEGKFLESLVKIMNTKKVLEVGTFKGFSSIFIARALGEDGKLVTCEKDFRSWPIAEDFWKRLGLAEKIELRKETALDVYDGLIQKGEEFDLIFIDGDKGNYKTYLEKSMLLLRSGGVVLVDNILWAGLVADEDPGDNVGRDLKKFNEYVFETYGASVSIVPAWDGLLMIVKE